MLLKMDLRKLILLGIEHYWEKTSGVLIEKLNAIVVELLRWKKHINLTGFKNEESVIKNLVFEALFVLKYLRDRTRIVDAGSGSGIMAFVFALFLPSEILSIERNTKKATFQKHIKRLIDIPNLTILNGAIEEIEPLGADAVFAKAFGKTEAIVKKTDKHLLKMGILLLPKGIKEEPRKLPNYILEKNEAYVLFMGNRQSRLLIYRKIR
ncbi:MAG: class I SAM-dependent methyltransferase [Desulfobacterota bacterium]|nr:class I SAM-dependent methyltransferase [Thermodesulfobacteriota bacterium]MDW8002274.1 class I SAM-dependent methyltransferase [Deltaproteobacteria bacterium]